MPERFEIDAYALELPDDFDEGHWESKGWFPGATLQGHGMSYALTFYDPMRLAQTIADELAAQSFFFERNLIVVAHVSRVEIVDAVRRLVQIKGIQTLTPSR